MKGVGGEDEDERLQYLGSITVVVGQRQIIQESFKRNHCHPYHKAPPKNNFGFAGVENR